MGRLELDELNKITKKFKIQDEPGLVRIIEQATEAIEIFKGVGTRITADDIEGLKRFAKSANRSLKVWDNLKPNGRELIAFMAHMMGSPLADNSLIDSNDGKFLEGVDTELIEKAIEQQLKKSVP